MKEKKTTHFGFKTVFEEEKAPLVREIFDHVASRYDMMNDLMSLGIHRIWKNHFVTQLCAHQHEHLLDLAGGTGDIAQRFIQKGGTHVTITDINDQMIQVGRKRAYNQGLISPITWVVGDGQSLPFPDHHFDACTIAFGLRNITDPMMALKEIYRVLKKGGKFQCLEFSHISNPVIKKVYEKYAFHILPKLGKKVAKNEQAYQYLVESITQFPTQETLRHMMNETQFKNTSYENLSAGIAAIHHGWKI